MLINEMKKWLRSTEAVTAVEYGLIAAGIAVSEPREQQECPGQKWVTHDAEPEPQRVRRLIRRPERDRQPLRVRPAGAVLVVHAGLIEDLQSADRRGDDDEDERRAEARQRDREEHEGDDACRERGDAPHARPAQIPQALEAHLLAFAEHERLGKERGPDEQDHVQLVGPRGRRVQRAGVHRARAGEVDGESIADAPHVHRERRAVIERVGCRQAARRDRRQDRSRPRGAARLRPVMLLRPVMTGMVWRLAAVGNRVRDWLAASRASSNRSAIA